MTMNCCCGTCNWCLANWKGENPAKSEKSLEETVRRMAAAILGGLLAIAWYIIYQGGDQ